MFVIVFIVLFTLVCFVGGVFTRYSGFHMETYCSAMHYEEIDSLIDDEGNNISVPNAIQKVCVGKVPVYVKDGFTIIGGRDFIEVEK